jgi:hypothetical protein
MLGPVYHRRPDHHASTDNGPAPTTSKDATSLERRVTGGRAGHACGAIRPLIDEHGVHRWYKPRRRSAHRESEAPHRHDRRLLRVKADEAGPASPPLDVGCQPEEEVLQTSTLAFDGANFLGILAMRTDSGTIRDQNALAAIVRAT